jgi:septum formation topological specificity factor MinE
VVELKMIVQDEDEQAALDYVRRLRRKVMDVEQRHCGDPDRLPGY